MKNINKIRNYALGAGGPRFKSWYPDKEESHCGSSFFYFIKFNSHAQKRGRLCPVAHHAVQREGPRPKVASLAPFNPGIPTKRSHIVAPLFFILSNSTATPKSVVDSVL